MNIEVTDSSQFKVGDKVRILKLPLKWNDSAGGANPLHEDLTFPYDIVIQDIVDNGIFCGTYGWSANYIIGAGCEIIGPDPIFESDNKFPFKVYKKNKMYYIR